MFPVSFIPEFDKDVSEEHTTQVGEMSHVIARVVRDAAVKFKQSIQYHEILCFYRNSKIKIKSNSIKAFVVAMHYNHQTRGENRLILAILNETFAFIK